MKYSTVSVAVLAVFALNACDKRETIVQPASPPAVVTVPGPKETITKETIIQPAPPPAVVTVPGPAGPPGAPGPAGTEGPKGEPGGGTVVIVPAPEKR